MSGCFLVDWWRICRAMLPRWVWFLGLCLLSRTYPDQGMISSTTWSLTEMCGTHLKIQREDVDPEDTHSYFDHTLSSPDRLVKFIRLCEIDAYFQMAIASRVQMLPLTKQLTNLAGNSWWVSMSTRTG